MLVLATLFMIALMQSAVSGDCGAGCYKYNRWCQVFSDVSGQKWYMGIRAYDEFEQALGVSYFLDLEEEENAFYNIYGGLGGDPVETEWAYIEYRSDCTPECDLLGVGFPVGTIGMGAPIIEYGEWHARLVYTWCSHGYYYEL
jgi:hypothetical protein